SRMVKRSPSSGRAPASRTATEPDHPIAPPGITARGPPAELDVYRPPVILAGAGSLMLSLDHGVAASLASVSRSSRYAAECIRAAFLYRTYNLRRVAQKTV